MEAFERCACDHEEEDIRDDVLKARVGELVGGPPPELEPVVNAVVLDEKVGMMGIERVQPGLAADARTTVQYGREPEEQGQERLTEHKERPMLPDECLHVHRASDGRVHEAWEV